MLAKCRLLLFSLLASLALGLAISLPPAAAASNPNNFTITNFKSDETLTRADPQGQLHIIEHINVNFPGRNHGILRAIPKSYKGRPLHLRINKVSSSSGAPARYSTYEQNGNEVLKIGNPDKTVTGRQEYTIDYTVQNVITFYDSHDELYWDINGNEWREPATHVSLALHLPAKLKLSKQGVKCFTGGYGEDGSACATAKNGHTIRAKTTSELKPRQTLTIVAGFGKGYFQPAGASDWLGDYWRPIVAFLALPVILGGGAFLLWLKRGRDARGRGTIVPEYEPPDMLSPIEAGTIADFKVDNRDITATIISLAIRGYLKIIEKKQDKRLWKKAEHSYLLELRGSDTSECSGYERMILRALFEDQFETGRQVDLLALQGNFVAVAAALRDLVSRDLIKQKYFNQNPLKSWHSLGVIVAVLFIGGLILGSLLGLAAIAGAFVAAGIIALFAHFMPSRTAKGVRAKEHIEGLKLYMETAEADRLKMMQSPDARYAQKSKAPKKTVRLFEELLPYAIALGVEDGWANQFKHIYKTPPEWYAGSFGAFNAVVFASALGSGFSPAVNSAFMAPSSAVGSGFGGGGFAGGGGGGGGGGGW
jgi:uncharacterized membrane protein YgcG